MDKTKKILIGFLLIILSLSATPGEWEREVYFPAETPYLLQIEESLTKHNLLLSSDSLNTRYKGQLFFYPQKDSIRCEIQIKEGEELPHILDVFMLEAAGRQSVWKSLRNFSICLLILNAITAILFLLRSS